MKSRMRLLRIIIPLIIVVIGIKILQHNFSVVPFLLLVTALGYLLAIVIASFVKKGKSSKYERKPQSPWGALNEGIDPTI